MWIVYKEAIVLQQANQVLAAALGVPANLLFICSGNTRVTHIIYSNQYTHVCSSYCSSAAQPILMQPPTEAQSANALPPWVRNSIMKLYIEESLKRTLFVKSCCTL